jgi:hypothetical protein
MVSPPATSEAGAHAAGDTKSEHFEPAGVRKLSAKQFICPPNTATNPNLSSAQLPAVALSAGHIVYNQLRNRFRRVRKNPHMMTPYSRCALFR